MTAPIQPAAKLHRTLLVLAESRVGDSICLPEQVTGGRRSQLFSR